MDHAVQIDGQDAVPVGQVELLEQAAEADAGVVEEVIQLAGALLGGRDRGVHGRGLGLIAGCADVHRRGFGQFDRLIRQGDDGPAPRQFPSQTAADARGSPSDNRRRSPAGSQLRLSHLVPTSAGVTARTAPRAAR